MFDTKYSKNRNNYSGKSKKKGLKFEDGGVVGEDYTPPPRKKLADEGEETSTYKPHVLRRPKAELNSPARLTA
jgi:hypothetical protein